MSKAPRIQVLFQLPNHKKRKSIKTIVKYFVASNTPFSLAYHNLFKIMNSVLIPAYYTPQNSKIIIN